MSDTPQQPPKLKGLRAPIRPGSGDVRGQQATMFPFDWFTFNPQTKQIFLKPGYEFLFTSVSEGFAQVFVQDDEPTGDIGEGAIWIDSNDGNRPYDYISGAWVENRGSSQADTATDDAADAQATADVKRRVFVTTPTSPYDVGDLWVDTSAGVATGITYRCKTARASGAFSSAEWERIPNKTSLLDYQPIYKGLQNTAPSSPFAGWRYISGANASHASGSDHGGIAALVGHMYEYDVFGDSKWADVSSTINTAAQEVNYGTTTINGGQLTTGTVTALAMAAASFFFALSVGNGPANGAFGIGDLHAYMGTDTDVDPLSSGDYEFAIKALLKSSPNRWRTLMRMGQRSADDYSVDMFLSGIGRMSEVETKFGFQRSKKYEILAGTIFRDLACSDTGVCIACGNSEKAYKSIDGGKTWTVLSPTFAGTPVIDVVIWLGGTSWGMLSDGEEFILSTDDGASWGTAIATGATQIDSSAVNARVYTGTAILIRKDTTSTADSKKIRRSINNGTSWADVTVFTSGGATEGILTIAYDSFTNTLVATQRLNQRIAISTDHGATWTEVTTGLSFLSTGTNRVYAYNGRIHLFPDNGDWRYSDDAGANWIDGSVTFANTATPFIGTPYGLFFDTGTTYMSYDNGLTVENVPNAGGYTLGVYDPIHNCLIMLVTGASVPDSVVRLLPIEAGFPGQSIAHNVYTATGTYEAKWAGWRKVTAIGGGGSGGSADANATSSFAAASGGEGGAYAVFWVWMDSGDVLYLTVGLGGTAPSAGNNNGNAGGDTKVGSNLGGAEYVTAGGGFPGIAAQSGANAEASGAPASGSAVTWGPLVAASEILVAVRGSGSNRSFSASLAISGSFRGYDSPGGKSPIGPQPHMDFVASGANAGRAGIGPGAGGGGAACRTTATDAAGAAGNDGIVIVEAAA